VHTVFIISSPVSIPGQGPRSAHSFATCGLSQEEHRRNTVEEHGHRERGKASCNPSHISSTLSPFHPFTAAGETPVEWLLLACQARPTAAALLICRCFNAAPPPPSSDKRCAVSRTPARNSIASLACSSLLLLTLFLPLVACRAERQIGHSTQTHIFFNSTTG
jgi:hypothetical protein